MISVLQTPSSSPNIGIKANSFYHSKTWLLECHIMYCMLIMITHYFASASEDGSNGDLIGN